jgi:hypothetical protein
MYIAWFALYILLHYLVVIFAQTIHCQPVAHPPSIIDCLSARERLLPKLLRLTPNNPQNDRTRLMHFEATYDFKDISATDLSCNLIVSFTRARETLTTPLHVLDGINRVITECVF